MIKACIYHACLECVVQHNIPWQVGRQVTCPIFIPRLRCVYTKTSGGDNQSQIKTLDRPVCSYCLLRSFLGCKFYKMACCVETGVENGVWNGVEIRRLVSFNSWWRGSCIDTPIWRFRKTLSQWERSFHWKLCFHWLNGLHHCQIAVVTQGPGDAMLRRIYTGEIGGWNVMWKMMWKWWAHRRMLYS